VKERGDQCFGVVFFDDHSAEIEHLIDNAARHALHDRRPITQQDILSVMGANPPRLNRDKIEKMRKPIVDGGTSLNNSVDELIAL